MTPLSWLVTALVTCNNTEELKKEPKNKKLFDNAMHTLCLCDKEWMQCKSATHHKIVHVSSSSASTTPPPRLCPGRGLRGPSSSSKST
mmetsp:Transcript_770/g.1110  ORF Transcript_770/g.1110 Transcript_770/m.1110 type:complete len:88 (-) Transcript_770:319-582(-)